MLQLTLAVGRPLGRAGLGLGGSCPGAGPSRLSTQPLAAPAGIVLPAGRAGLSAPWLPVTPEDAVSLWLWPLARLGQATLLPSLLLPLGYPLPNWASLKAPSPGASRGCTHSWGLLLPSPAPPVAASRELPRAGRRHVTSMGDWVSCVPGTAVVPKFQMKKWRLAEGCRW